MIRILVADQQGVIREGASGYLSKSTPPEKLLVAIRRIASGRRYIVLELSVWTNADVVHYAMQHRLECHRSLPVTP
jgi:hypothetical protein